MRMSVWTRHTREKGTMDASRFDQFSKALAGANSRRRLVQAAATLAAAGVPVLMGTAAAQGKKRQGVGAEHWRKKKRFYCLNGETIRRYRRKQEKLLAMGATLGKCSDVPCVPTTCKELGYACGSPADGCGGTLSCGACTDSELNTCCSGTCVSLFDLDNCGACGVVCPDDWFCNGSECVEG